MNYFLLLILATFSGSVVRAQLVADTLSGGVVVFKDARYDLLSKKKADINKKAVAAKKPTKGFRIQVLNTTNRNDALNAKSKLLTLYPDHKAYLMYQAPYFKLRMGNFIDRKDADAIKKELNRLFPSGVFVIPSEIEVKTEKEETQ